MEPVLYLDIFFLNNLMMDFLLVFVAQLLRRRPVRWHRSIAAAVAGACYSCILTLMEQEFRGLVPPWASVVLSYLVISCLLSWILWGFCGLGHFLADVLCLYGSSFLLGGIMMLLKQYLDEFWMLTGGSGVVALLCGGMILQKHSYDQGLVWVELIHHGKRIRLLGLWDTGNSLCDPISHRPVCVARGEKIQPLLAGGLEEERIGMVPFCSIGEEQGMLLAVEINEIRVKVQGGEKGNESTKGKKGTKRIGHTFEKVWVGLSHGGISRNLPYEILLNPLLLEELNKAEVRQKSEKL